MTERVRSLELDNLEQLRRKLSTYEGHCSNAYFQQIFSLFPESVRPENRKGFHAYDGVNNLFNLGYELLSWKVHKALVGAKLEPFLGFSHSEQFDKPSLVCDFMELYRFLIDDFIVQFFSDLREKDFVMKSEIIARKRIGKREYLNDFDSNRFMERLNQFFESEVQIPRIKVGNRQTLETLISEEALMLAKYLRDERQDWAPRIPTI
jgi:CRISPR-associated protein Cas1